MHSRRTPTARAYTGIGSRRAPSDVLAIMTTLAGQAAMVGLILRSGAADGADTAFETGALRADGPAEIYLPDTRFNGRTADARRYRYDAGALPEAMRLAERHWRSNVPWARLRPFTQRLMARNVHQVLGPDLASPSSIVLFWTPSPETGGTTQALRIARAHDIACVRCDTLKLAHDGIRKALGLSLPELPAGAGR